MDQKPDWNISELYSRAWVVIKKNKILWVLGAAAGVGSSYNFRSSNFNSDDFQKLFNQNPSTQNAPQKLTEVLGASTNKPFTDAVVNLFSSVPIGWYFLGALELILVVVLGLVIMTIYQSWSQGMLLQATATALLDQKVTIADTAKLVLPKLKSLLWLNIIPGLVFFLAITVAVMVITLGIALTPFPIKILFIILAVVSLGAAIYWGIFLAASLIWAPREILLNNQSGKASLIAGYKIAKKKFWASLLLGVVNNILAAVIFLVPILIGVAFVVGVIFAGFKSTVPLPLIIVAGVITGLPILIGFMLLGGIIAGFKAVVWTDAYSKIKGKYDH